MFIRLFSVCLCGKTVFLSHDNILFELANYILYGRNIYSYDRKVYSYEKKLVFSSLKHRFLFLLTSPLSFFTNFFCRNISEFF